MARSTTITKIAATVGILCMLWVAATFRFHVWFYTSRSANAAKSIAFSYLDGSNGFTPDYTKARHWLRIAADKGDGESMSNLAWVLETGRGGSPNQEEALYWYRRAQQQGDQRAEIYLRNRGLLH